MRTTINKLKKMFRPKIKRMRKLIIVGLTLLFLISMPLAGIAQSLVNQKIVEPTVSNEKQNLNPANVNTLILLGSEDREFIQDIITTAESSGGKIVFIYPPRVLIGNVPANLYPLLIGQEGVIGVYNKKAVDVSIVKNFGDLALQGVKAWNNMLEGKTSLLSIIPKPGSISESGDTDSRTLYRPSSTLEATRTWVPPYPYSWHDTGGWGIGGAESQASRVNGGIYGRAWANTGGRVGYGSQIITFIAPVTGQAIISADMLYTGDTDAFLAGYSGFGYYSYINEGDYQEVSLETSWLSTFGSFIDLIATIYLPFPTLSITDLSRWLSTHGSRNSTWRRSFNIVRGQCYIIEAGMFAKASAMVLGTSGAAIAGQYRRITLNYTPNVVINEVYSDAINNSGDMYNETSEWIELYNTSDWNVDISNWAISTGSPRRTTRDDITFPRGTVIPARGYYLIGDSPWMPDNSGWPVLNYTTQMTLTNWDGWVKLEDNYDVVIDIVGWGGANIYEGRPYSSNPSQGKSIERRWTDLDTNNNAADFVLRNTPTPTRGR